MRFRSRRDWLSGFLIFGTFYVIVSAILSAR